MNNPEVFRPRNNAEIDHMVAAYPLALVISHVDGNTQASPLPIDLQRDAQDNGGGEGTLIGHFSRHNPQLEMIRRNPRALIAFSGAQGYISTSWLQDRRYAPTWNYEAVHFTVDITLEEGHAATERALRTLIDQVDAPYPNPWSPDEMGARFKQLAEYVVPFKARIIETQAQFKLGQGDPQSLINDALGALQRYGNHSLALAMRRQLSASGEAA